MVTKISEPVVLVSSSNGLVIIPENTPLKRLNYFDGKFLRASDLKDEQDYLRHLVWLSNQAGGSGVVHGFDLTLGGGDTLDLGPGLAINPDGRVLLLPQGLSLAIQELIDKSQALQAFFKKGNVVGTEDFKECDLAGEGPPITTTHANDLYLIVISPADALCGEADVYGKLCEEACATSTDRPFALEGVIVRAIPLVLQTPLPLSTAIPIATKLHLRSRVASAYFEDERKRVAAMISGFGLEQQTWCLGAEAANGGGVPIGVIARAGATTSFLDGWIARRERIDTPPRRYWQWRMMMRPWDVFLAQILQFQCQLRDVVGGVPTPGGEDPCGDARTVIGEAAKKIADLLKVYKESNITGQGQFDAKLSELESMSEKLTSTEQQMKFTGEDRLLIRKGIVELPSAGYLPVVPGLNASINQQIHQLMGDGVDLRFCAVRPDFVAHALEEAQHMERISLIEGLDNPKKRPQVDILVPDGEFVVTEQPDKRLVYAADGQIGLRVDFAPGESRPEPKSTEQILPLKGAARVEALPLGGTALYLGATSPVTPENRGGGFDQQTGATLGVMQGEVELGLWLDLHVDHNLMLLKTGDKTSLGLEAMFAPSIQSGSPKLAHAKLNGVLTVGPPEPNWPVTGTLVASYSVSADLGVPVSSNTELDFRAKQPTPKSIEIHLRTNSGRTNIAIEADWSNPVHLKPLLSVKFALTERVKAEYRVELSLTKDANIFSPTHVNHAEAIQAVQYVGAAQTNDPTFVTNKTNLLFPPPPPPASAAVLRATRDWVLFHRRRTKRCDVEAAIRRYRVYEGILQVRSKDTFDLPKQTPTKEEILNAKSDAFKDFRYVGDATFAADGVTPLGDLGALKSSWQKAPEGSILWGAIASQGEAVNDAESLAMARVKTLEPLLDAVNPGAVAMVLPIVPPPLETPGNDGVILLVVGTVKKPTYYAYGTFGVAIGTVNLDKK